MKVSNCRKCRQRVSVHFDVCPHCGSRVPILPANDLLKFLAVVILFAVLIGGFVALINHETDDNDSTKRSSASANAAGASL
jgi:hypothetical protein